MSAAASDLTVVIPAYQREAQVAHAVASVLAQRTPVAEVVVVDDGSTDGTVAAAEAAGARVVRHDRNRGTAAARNTGVRAARTGWVALLDSDDEWLPRLVEVLWPRRDGHVLLGGGGIAVGGERLRYRGAPWSRPHVLRSPAQAIVPENPFVTSAVLLHAPTVLALGGFAEDRRRSEDLDLWFRLLEVGTGLVVPEVVVRYHHHGQQKTTALADTRVQQQAILATYADRDWYRPALLALETAHRWDELRERAGSRAALVRGLPHVAGTPRRAGALARLLASRARVRRRTGDWTTDGERAGGTPRRLRSSGPAGPPAGSAAGPAPAPGPERQVVGGR